MHRQTAGQFVKQAVERYLLAHPQKNSSAWKARASEHLRVARRGGSRQSARDELLAHRTADRIVAEALAQALSALSAFDTAQSLDKLQLCVLNPRSPRRS